METLYKVLGENGQSFHGGKGIWTPHQWRSIHGEIVPCHSGIHYCRRDQLINWIGGPTIWTFEDGTPDEVVDAGDKMVTRKGRVLTQIETWNARTARLFAADVAEMALVYIPEARRDPFVASINAARGFARGEIGSGEMTAARDAARDAARAAARAAAWDAARAAAWDAARAAAWDAAWAAAWDAARAAARDAARADQTSILFDYLEGRRT